jgi:Tfp pilus assembly protein PilN
MLPVRLNLLAPPKRAIARRLVYAQFARNMIEIAVFLASFAGIVLLQSFFILQEHLTDLSIKLTAISHNQSLQNKEIKSVNDTLRQTDALQKQYTQWSRVIPEVLGAIPNGITLSTLILSAPGNSYSFAGVASTRNDLLSFQKNLQSLPNVASAVVPISQLTDKENISFSISATLK